MTYVVFPAYNAAATIKATLESIPDRAKYQILVCDDASSDNTVQIAHELGLEVIVHPQNRGYGANQKTLYNTVLGRNEASSDRGEIPHHTSTSSVGTGQASNKEESHQNSALFFDRNEMSNKRDIIIMLHPDNQYDGSVIPKMVELIQNGRADFVLGNRMSADMPKQAGMPRYKQFSNHALTNFQSRVYGVRLGEFHTGLRAYRHEVLEKINFNQFSDDFVFDSEMIAAAIARGFHLAEVPVQARYFKEASSINFRRSVKYGLETLKVLWKFKRGYYNQL